MLKVILYSYASIFQMQNLQDFCDSSRFHIHNIKERNHQNTDNMIAKYCVSCTFSSTFCISSSAFCISTITSCISSSTSCISSGTPLIWFLAYKLSAGANNPLSQIVVSHTFSSLHFTTHRARFRMQFICKLPSLKTFLAQIKR